MKEELKQFREEIAALEKEQINMKAQRKTVNLKVKRTVNPYDAAQAVDNNRYKLRIMYAAYGLMKGRRFEQIENHYDKENNQIHPLYGFASSINDILNKYGYTMEYKEVQAWYGKRKEFKEGCDEKIVRISEQEA